MMTTVLQEWGMNCPKCDLDDKIYIRSEDTGHYHVITSDNKELFYPHEVQDENFAYCGHCFFEGSLNNFKNEEDA